MRQPVGSSTPPEERGPRREERARVQLPEAGRQRELEAGQRQAPQVKPLRLLAAKQLQAAEQLPVLQVKLLRLPEGRPRPQVAKQLPLLVARRPRPLEERLVPPLAARPALLRQAAEGAREPRRPPAERRLRPLPGIRSRRMLRVRRRLLKPRAVTGRILIAADMWPRFTQRAE
jgi:hypothetical protein